MALMTRRALLAVAAVAVACAAPLNATVSIPTDLADAAAGATVIVRGRVLDTRAFTEIANGPVMTAVTIAVDDVLKGEAESTITFRVHGGAIGRYRYTVIGSPVLTVGDVAYFFLRRASGGALWPVGMSAGVYQVAPSTGLVNAPIVNGVTASVDQPVARGDVRRKPMRPAEFANLVRFVLAAQSPSAGRGGKDVPKKAKGGRP